MLLHSPFCSAYVHKRVIHAVSHKHVIHAVSHKRVIHAVGHKRVIAMMLSVTACALLRSHQPDAEQIAKGDKSLGENGYIRSARE